MIITTYTQMSWVRAREEIKRVVSPETFLLLGLDRGDATDAVICKYNANTFPKENRWVDENGRFWVMEGDPNVWNVKLPRNHDICFPDVHTKLTLVYNTKTVFVSVQCVVLSITEQSYVVIGVHGGSRVCAKAELSVTGEIKIIVKV